MGESILPDCFSISDFYEQPIGPSEESLLYWGEEDAASSMLDFANLDFQPAFHVSNGNVRNTAMQPLLADGLAPPMHRVPEESLIPTALSWCSVWQLDPRAEMADLVKSRCTLRGGRELLIEPADAWDMEEEEKFSWTTTDYKPGEPDFKASQEANKLEPDFEDASKLHNTSALGLANKEIPADSLRGKCFQITEISDNRTSPTANSEDKTKTKLFCAKKPKKKRGPKLVITTRSDVDIIDDGYKWRKYGQTFMKNSLFPRSYYKCTYKDCYVKKRVQRQADEPSEIVTTYEGSHIHVIPAPIQIVHRPICARPKAIPFRPSFEMGLFSTPK